MGRAWEHGCACTPLPTAQRELRAADLEAVREQLGREPTTPFTVVARCTGGHPLVIRNAPFDAAAAPFPTTYWLTCPDAVKAVVARGVAAVDRPPERAHRSDEAFGRGAGGRARAYADDRAARPRGGTRRGVGSPAPAPA